MKPASLAKIVVTLAFAAAAMVYAQFSANALEAPARQAGEPVRVAVWESPLEKWKRQCRRSGGKYEKYCAGGVKHCCCYSASYCEGMPEPAGTLQLPPPSGSGPATTAPGLKPLKRAQ